MWQVHTSFGRKAWSEERILGIWCLRRERKDHITVAWSWMGTLWQYLTASVRFNCRGNSSGWRIIGISESIGVFFFLIFCWPCVSIYLFLNINQLEALNFCNKFISSLYMFRVHVLIVRRAKLYYTVSGIITHIGGRPVHRFSASSWLILINKS